MKPKKKQYSKLPFKFLEAIQLFTRAEIIIYSVLCVRANKEKKTWPGVKSLMKDAGVTKPTVTKTLKKLRKYGFLELVSRRYHDTSVYRITEPEDMSPVFQELERIGVSHFEWRHDNEDNEKSKSKTVDLDSDEDTNQEFVKVKSSDGKSKAQQESKLTSPEVEVRSDVAVTTLTRTTLNRSTLKDLIGKFNLKFLSDNRLGKDSSLVSSEASFGGKATTKQEIPRNGNPLLEEIQEVSENSFQPVTEVQVSGNPVEEISNRGAKEILESSGRITNSQPMESDEVSSGTDNLTEQGNQTVRKYNLAPETINQRIMVQKFGLSEFPTYSAKLAFISFEKTRGGQAFEDLVLKAYGTADDFQEAMMNLSELIY